VLRFAKASIVERDLILTLTAEGRGRAKAPRAAHGAASISEPEPRKEATDGAQGATLQELAHSYNVDIYTIRATAAA
jgi:hypothetical protein